MVLWDLANRPLGNECGSRSGAPLHGGAERKLGAAGRYAEGTCARCPRCYTRTTRRLAEGGVRASNGAITVLFDVVRPLRRTSMRGGAGVPGGGGPRRVADGIRTLPPPICRIHRPLPPLPPPL